MRTRSRSLREIRVTLWLFTSSDGKNHFFDMRYPIF
ncbi:hypothetical protein NMYAN_10236 [Nitrosomonas nitrosa]|uniref:Uncharacterized protein n=1 Tax=Nitrosomonas nitrosa TaxID=52442 RepID=A0A8H8YW48_9PROT|nr:hypothetical protein NMYAN_10236 [Nitrosomonas nitrosa]